MQHRGKFLYVVDLPGGFTGWGKSFDPIGRLRRHQNTSDAVPVTLWFHDDSRVTDAVEEKLNRYARDMPSSDRESFKMESAFGDHHSYVEAVALAHGMEKSGYISQIIPVELVPAPPAIPVETANTSPVDGPSRLRVWWDTFRP
jgi:hypothetical protein